MLRVVPRADLTQFGPVFSSVVITRICGLMVYESLFAWDSKLQARPQMAQSWTTSPDGLTWRFTLRPGLKFHDGQPVHQRRCDPVAETLDGARRGLPESHRRHHRHGGDRPRDLEITLSHRDPGMLFALGSGIGRPVALRGTITGFPPSPVIVYWNLAKQ